MTPTYFLVGLAVFVSAALIDLANSRYVLAVTTLAPHRAARWSVLQWAASLVGFLVAVKMTLWMLPVEMLGLYTGTWLSLRWSRDMLSRAEITTRITSGECACFRKSTGKRPSSPGVTPL